MLGGEANRPSNPRPRHTHTHTHTHTYTHTHTHIHTHTYHGVAFFPSVLDWYAEPRRETLRKRLGLQMMSFV